MLATSIIYIFVSRHYKERTYLQSQLDEATFAAAWAAGRALTLEQAIADALGEHAGLIHV